MAVTLSSPNVEFIAPDDPRRPAALRLVVSGSAPASADGNAAVRQLEKAATDQGLCTELLIAAFRASEMIAAALAVEAPGGTAMIHLGLASHDPAAHHTSVSLLRMLRDQVCSRGAVLLQALLAEQESASAAALREAGFRRMAELLYLERSNQNAVPRRARPPALRWIAYSPENEAVFLRALELTYVETLDCASLSGVRNTADVLRGHRATGLHDPSLWFVALAGDEPAGALLLSPVGDRRLVEVVYMGVAWPMRRRGIAGALLEHACAVTAERGFEGLTLAVDAVNTPALRLYGRFGFVEFARRWAWVYLRET